MTIAIAICAIAGMAMGFRFKVYMVVPAIIAAALATATISTLHGVHFWSMAATIAASAIALQLGYVCATFAAAMKEVPVAETIPVTGAVAKAYQPRDGFSA